MLNRLKLEAKAHEKSITSDHKNFELSFAMMSGIHNSAGRSKTSTEGLHVNEFMRIEHTVFPPGGSTGENATPPTGLKETFEFKDYAPVIFSKIRGRFNVDTADYLISLGGVSTYTEFTSNSKSGQFFFFSADNKYMIKSQSKAESKFLRRILPHYFQHVMNNPETYMTRFYGMHRVNMVPYKDTHFVIMANVFYTKKDIQVMYDLKGSSIGREATPEELEKFERGGKVVLKDNDMLHPVRGNKMHVGHDYKGKMLQQLKKDVTFLAKLKIMDYSLLVGINQSKKTTSMASKPVEDGERKEVKLVEDGEGKEVKPIQGGESKEVKPVEDGEKEEVKPIEDGERKEATDVPTSLSITTKGAEEKKEEIIVDEGIPSKGIPDPETYFIGIIDILQVYNTKKAVENFAKGFSYDRHEISAVNPVEYATRFLTYVNKVTD